jgi:hypothetical protein
MKNRNFIILAAALLVCLCMNLTAQTRVTTRGNAAYERVGIHNGNLVHTVFTNYGVIAQPSLTKYPRGAWKYDNNGYVGDVSPLFGILNPIKKYTPTTTGVQDTVADTLHTVVITAVSRPGGGKTSPGGKSWTLEPIPGFFNPAINQDGKGVAMSHQPDTWPSSWPDQPTWSFTESPYTINGDTITPSVDWNGYFGRGTLKIATQESYFWMDDNNDTQMFDSYGFLPDSNDVTRRGHALQVSVRGLQWGGDPVAQNCLFWLYNIKNDGTTTYDQSAFGLLVGTYVGIMGDEYNDDASFFDVRQSITYTWDFDNYIRPSANPYWLPNPSAVGYVAYAFLESPGNGIDGIDNDHDNATMGPSLAPYFIDTDFNSRTLSTGDKYVLISKDSLYIKPNEGRSVHTVGTKMDTVYSMGVKFVVGPGVVLPAEGNYDNSTLLVNPNAIDGIDNNLNGLIDECYTTHYRQYKKSPKGIVLIDTLNATQHFDFINSVGLSDWMIDERRDDGIDNDHDWSVLTDDLGADGKDSTHDAGEHDGIPTHGEPNFDDTDVHESDQLGLTSFQYFVPASDIKMSDNEAMWTRMKPGYYDVPQSVVNNVATKGEDGDFIYASGYFPLRAGQTERFSLALAFGDDLNDVIKTKRIVQIIYNANYQFPKAPDVPSLTVVPGDNKVTLYWNHVSEQSIDPVSKEKDFEGYKIYKSTSYTFADKYLITDATGKDIAYKSYQQFDLADGITGYFPLTNTLRDLYSGYSPYLGNDSGIRNSFVDTAVVNGRTYYYILTSYDRGNDSTETFPKENPVDGCITKNSLGVFSLTQNAGIATPAKPAAGYVAPPSGLTLNRLSGQSSAGIYFEVVDPYKLRNTTYNVSFVDKYVPEVHGTDTVWQGPVAGTYSVRDSASGSYLVKNSSFITPSNGLVFEGVRLSIDTTYQPLDSIRVKSNSFWKIHNNRDTVNQPLLSVSLNSSVKSGTKYLYMHKLARDYNIVFNNTYTDSSNDLYSLIGSHNVSKNINFKVYDVTDSLHPYTVKFAFADQNKDSTISSTERIFLSDSTGSQLSWLLSFTKPDTIATHVAYKATVGDTIQLRFYKPITSADAFSFVVNKAAYSSTLASEQMSKIKVVPNPYVVTNLYETPPPSGLTGRGERVIRFNNLPQKCKIYIYTSSGDLVRTIEHNESVLNGSEKWDLRTREGLDVAYGVYFYVVEADGISEPKTGKIAIIK